MGALVAPQGAAWAEDVTVNLDALEPAPAKKPAKPAVAKPVTSEIVPDPAPMAIDAPKPKPEKVPPKPALKPVAAPSSAANGEIDFIGKTKRAQGLNADDAAVPPAPPTAPKPKPAPVMAAPVPDELPAAPKPAAIAKPAAPKKKPAPATVVVDDGALEGDAGAKLTGTPLTSLTPDGVLYVPKNTDNLPQPVAVPDAAASGEPDAKALTLPPSLPDAPLTAPAAPMAPAAAPVAPQPSAMALQPAKPKPVKPPAPSASAPPPAAIELPQAEPPTTQAVAAVSVAPPVQPVPPQARSSVLTGQATALELTFDPLQTELTADAQAKLDQIAEPLKAGQLRVQLAAYSGEPGNSSSDARRLSLKRALAVRDYLSTLGVPKLTVNIAAFGGASQGRTDRVDLMVRTDQLGKLSGVQ